MTDEAAPPESLPAESVAPVKKASQPHNPLHGLTLEAIVTALADYYGWEGLGQQVPVRCFTVDPSVGSSLKFLRKTPWARDKVESLYLFMLREQRREQKSEPKAEKERARPPGG
ncbi:hypothetical protein BH11PSE13_BH11PSE13_15910 [soil metagenome]